MKVRRVSPDWTIYKKFAAKRWSRDTPKLPFSSVRLSSTRVPAMKNFSVSSAHCPDQPQRSPKHSVTLMHHEENPERLGQQIHQLILNGSVPQTVLQQMAQLLGEAFQVDCCWVTIAAQNQENTTAYGSWYAQSAPSIEEGQMQLVQQALMMSTATDLLVVDDINIEKNNPLQEWRHLLPWGAILQIPVWFQGKLNGVVSLIRFAAYHWTDLDVKRARTIDSSLALAISHLAQSLLVTFLQQQAQKSVLSKTLLNQLSMLSRSSLDLNQILKLAIAGTAKALEVNRGFILLLRYVEPQLKSRTREKIPKAKANVVCEWSQNYNCDDTDQTSTLLNQSFWVSECTLSQFALSQFPQPLIFSDHCDLPQTEVTADVAPLFNLSNLPSLLMVPLENQGTVLGFLVLQDSNLRLWHPEEVSLVEMVCAQLSTTIIQHQTLRQVQTLVEERTTQLQRSLDVQGKLYEKTRQQIDQLRQLNQLKDEFLSTMSHELRTPLTSMNLAIRMLRQTGVNTERQAKYLDILEQQCTQEINLINDLLKLQQLESNQAPLKLETIDIKPKIQEWADCFTQKWADKGLAISLDLPKTSLLFQTDTESFERILQELLTNAGKYSAPDTAVSLKIAHQISAQANQLVLTVTNIGSGIASEDLDHIFDKFRRGQGVTQQAIQGTGLGLALVKCLVQQLNGSICATSNAINDSAYQTCFTLTLEQLPSPS